jgi:hypothetical protein
MLKLYKYRAFSNQIDRDRLRQLIETQQLFCSIPSDLNDPYDCNIGSADHLMHYLVKLGVFCTSGANHNDILLFSHYADRHRGACLEFEVDNERTIGGSSFLAFSEPIQYVENFPAFTAQTIHRLPKTKYIAWQYEDEHRVLASLDSNPSHFRSFEKNELIGIRFGLRMPEPDRRIIREWVNAIDFPNVIFWGTCLRNDAFGFEYRRLP